MPFWTPERDEILIKAWSKRTKADDIGLLFDPPLSKGSIIGRARRLNLESRARNANRCYANTPLRRFMPPAEIISALPPKKLDEKKADLSKIFVFDGVQENNNPDDLRIPVKKTVANVENGDCRWPVGDPRCADFHFCGEETIPGKVYCREHAARAYNTPSPKTKSFGKTKPTREYVLSK